MDCNKEEEAARVNILADPNKDHAVTKRSLDVAGAKTEYNKRRRPLRQNQLRSSSSETVERAKELRAAAETEPSYFNVSSERFRHEVEGKEKELALLTNQIESEEKREMEEETDRKKKDLLLILSKIKESGKQLAAVDKQLESQQRLLQIQLLELVSKENELEVKEKRVQELNNLINISGEELDLKSKELGQVQKLIEEQRKVLSDMYKQQPADACISQQSTAETEPGNELSAYLTRQDVNICLKASPVPEEYVLELMEKGLCNELVLSNLFVEILVLYLDELAKFQLSNELAEIQRLDKSQLQLKATKMATVWKGKMTKSSFEALAFLMFLVAYGLKKLINEDETALLGSSIAHYKQAPRLFNSLGLKLEMIQEFVKELVKKSQYIAAVRLICLFKLNKEFSFSPSELLMEEIINLRRSALKKRSSESSQGQYKDDGRLNTILKLVRDYKLEIMYPWGPHRESHDPKRKIKRTIDPSSLLPSGGRGSLLINKSTRLKFSQSGFCTTFKNESSGS